MGSPRAESVQSDEVVFQETSGQHWAGGRQLWRVHAAGGRGARLGLGREHGMGEGSSPVARPGPTRLTAWLPVGLPVTREPDWPWKGHGHGVVSCPCVGPLLALISAPAGGRQGGWEGVLLACSGPGSASSGPGRGACLPGGPSQSSGPCLAVTCRGSAGSSRQSQVPSV